MFNIIDRRKNPPGKSSVNKQRFSTKVKTQVKDAVKEALKNRSITDTGSERIKIKSNSTTEPTFTNSHKGGTRNYIVPGNKTYIVGDKLGRPEEGGGKGRGEGSPEDNGEHDDFAFHLTKDEFLNILFEDLELPDMEKIKVKDSTLLRPQRAGYVKQGPPANLSVKETMRNSLGRRLALHRPRKSEIVILEDMISLAEKCDDCELQGQLEYELWKLKRKAKIVAYIDPLDLRYRNFALIPKPSAQAVVFMLMDVSGSMTEIHKDIAKRFFLLLHTFLKRKYFRVDIVFIRHTSHANEVDENTFFNSTETGGTVVSTALLEELRVIRERYSPEDWNIYSAQASDGDNYTTDNPACLSCLHNDILPISQYFAYLEVETQDMGFGVAQTNMWAAYKGITEKNFCMKKAKTAKDVFPIFAELFKKKPH